ncbi:MAG TPA: hypothetical protein VHU41_01645 [Thermoanaerobaculia bacterium]|nr:hypothetical protein [Thermoanaerobaculia bacterium]
MNNELRLVAADGQLLPAGEPDVEARTILGLLANAAAMSATFHVLNTFHLELIDSAIQTRWHDMAAGNLEKLQKQGLRWISEAWPGAAAVPQAFVNAGNQAAVYAPTVDAALAAGDVALAARLLDGFSADLTNVKREVTAYRDQSGGILLGLLPSLGALTVGEASVTTVMAIEAAQTLQLLADIAAIVKRMEDRARKIAADTALHLANLDAMLFAIKHSDFTKPIMEWAKAYVTMVFIGTLPDLQREAFVSDVGEIYVKGSQVRQLSVDIFALANIGGVLLSLAGRAAGHNLTPVVGLLDAQKQRADALAAQLRTKPDVESARKAFAGEAARAVLLSEHCQRFQNAIVEAPREPKLLMFTPTEEEGGFR